MKKTRSLFVIFAILCVGGIAGAQTIPDFRLSDNTFFKPDTHFKNDRKVFAWYMVCCGPFGGNDAPYHQLLAQYKAEIQMAQSMGVDGFGLDIMEPNDVYHTAVKALFEAAKDLNSGFKLFFEFDYADPGMQSDDYANLVKKYHDHPNYFKTNGKALLCTYAADCIRPTPAASVQWWKDNLTDPLTAAGIKYTFIPGTFGKFGSADQDVAGWGDVAQGQSRWAIQLSPIGGGLATLENQGAALHKAHQAWMTTIATHYWVGGGFSVPSWYWSAGEALKADNSNRNGTYFEHAGGKGLDAQWASAMDIQKPEWVMLLTWNDFNESYMEPIDDYHKYKNGTAQGAPFGWYKPQAGMDELNRYFIQWYKTGTKPKITADSLFYAYVTHSYKIKADKDPRPPVGWGNPPQSDSLYLTTALTAPAQVRVQSGASSSSYDLSAGINHTVVPFDAGEQKFSIWRNGKQIAAVNGEPVVDKFDYYDYWPTTGYVEARGNK